MFGFNLRSLQNATGSPRNTNSPTTRTSSPNTATTSLESPKAEQVGEIDTSAPFQSVKAAVSLFGASPNSKPVVKKSKTPEEVPQRVLEKETHLHIALNKLGKFKEQLKNAEAAKAQAARELEKANRTLQELTSKLETASESKQAAIAETDAARNRARELEAQFGADRSAADGGGSSDCSSKQAAVDSEREQYKASSSQLIAAKLELTTIRQDFDAALEKKLAAIHEAQEAQHATKVNKERFLELSEEVAKMRETLRQVKIATRQVQQEQVKNVGDREAYMRSHKRAKEEVEKKIMLLKEEVSKNNLNGNLEERLEEATEGIAVVKDQLKSVRELDMQSLTLATMELEDAKNALQELISEDISLRSSIDALKQDLDEVRRELSEMSAKEEQSKSASERLRIELNQAKVELEEAIAEEAKQRQASAEMISQIEKLTSEAANARAELEDIRRNTEELKQEAEMTLNEAKVTEEKLKTALQEAEKAKAAAKLVDDQIHPAPPSADDPPRTNSMEKITMSAEDYENLRQKVKGFEKWAAAKVEATKAEVEERHTSELELVKKLEASLRELDDLKVATEDAMREAELAEAAKQAIEAELQRLRQTEDEDNPDIGESSHSKKESSPLIEL